MLTGKGEMLRSAGGDNSTNNEKIEQLHQKIEMLEQIIKDKDKIIALLEQQTDVVKKGA